MILHLIPSQSDGCIYHRIETPMHNLRGFELAQTTWLDGIDDDTLKKISLVVMSRDSGVDKVTEQIARLKKFGIPYVLDLDDYWKLNKEHLMYNDFDKTAQRWIELMKSASAITTTNARLAGKIAFHNENVVVCPNAIDAKQPQWKQKPSGNIEPVFGFVGGAHHLPDLNTMKGAFEQVRNEGVVNIALGGWTVGNDVYTVYEYWMTGGTKYPKYKRIKGEDVYNYAHIYDVIDVSIVPLLESKFTACKSNLKLIEAGFKNRACIVSRVAPYTDDFTDKDVIFCDTKSDWYQHMKNLHTDKNKLQDYTLRLKEKAMNEYSIEKINPIREQLYKTLINGK